MTGDFNMFNIDIDWHILCLENIIMIDFTRSNWDHKRKCRQSKN